MPTKLGLPAIVALLAASLAVSAAVRPAMAATPIVANGAWTVYHHDNGHTGFDPSLGPVTSVTAGWTSATLDGEVYTEPLVSGGIVYVGTLNNTVYALNQTDGTEVWHVNLGSPKTSGWVCGNVSPQGIIGTPVIDAAANRIYVTTFSNDSIYRVIGLDLGTGATRLSTPIPASIGSGFDWTIQQQRGALAVANGYVYVPFGGRAGDCGSYHGWVVAVPTDGVSALKVFETPSTAEGVWAAGGVVVDDATHNVFFATGNAIPCSGSQMSDAIIGTSPTLASPSFFEPNDWQVNWCAPDSDLGSASPVLISPNLMFTAGKHGGGFLLDPNNLGGVNGQRFPPPAGYVQADICAGNHSDATFGSFAYAPPFVYVECDNHGLMALKLNLAATSFSACGSSCAAPDWRAGGTTTFGPPIVAAGAVWVASNGGLTSYDAGTGALIYQSAAFGINRFVTPAEAGGHVFVPSHRVLKSFDMRFAPRESLSGVLASGPAVASWASNRIDSFVAGTDDGVWQDSWNGTQWQGWHSLGGILTADPSAVSWAANRIDILVRGTDFGLWHRQWDGTAWSNWELLGGYLTSGPGVASQGANRLDIVVRGTDNALYRKWYDSAGWHDWERIGGLLTSDPRTVSWGAGRLDVVVRGSDSALWHTWLDGAGWHPWERLGGLLVSAPAVSSCGTGKLEVFAVGTDNGLWRISFNGTWGTWQSLGGQWTSSPAAVCRPGTANTEVFLRGTDNGLWHLSF